MNKKYFISWLVVFIVWMAGSFLVHGLLLQAGYAELPHMFRPEEEAAGYSHLMIVAHILMAGAFVWIYARGIESGPWVGQGLRFGLAVALLTVVPTYTIYYVVQPMPGMHVIKQMAFDGLLLLILGVVVAFLYRNEHG